MPRKKNLKRDTGYEPDPVAALPPIERMLFRQLDALLSQPTYEQREAERERQRKIAEAEMEARFAEIRANPLTQRDPETGKYPLRITYGFPLGTPKEREQRAREKAEREQRERAGMGAGKVAKMPPPTQDRGHGRVAMKRK